MRVRLDEAELKSCAANAAVRMELNLVAVIDRRVRRAAGAAVCIPAEPHVVTAGLGTEASSVVQGAATMHRDGAAVAVPIVATAHVLIRMHATIAVRKIALARRGEVTGWGVGGIAVDADCLSVTAIVSVSIAVHLHAQAHASSRRRWV